MFEKIKEGRAVLYVPKEKKISRHLPVFYNPVMEENRTLSVLLLKALGKKRMRIADPLAGTGVRAIRFLKELPKGMVREMMINDNDRASIAIIRKNLRLSNVKADVSHNDANLFLLAGKGFDYIDIDPFGTPNPFLDSAARRLSRNSVLAVTATDTGPLAGTYPKACQRKYWAKPLHCPMMHELGLRILIRKIQLVGAQYDKALVPIFSYFSHHYFRVFLACSMGKNNVDEVLKQHSHVLYDRKTTRYRAADSPEKRSTRSLEPVGPLWTGSLGDARVIRKMSRLAPGSRLLQTIAAELALKTIGFYHVHELCKKNNIKNLPRHEHILAEIKKQKYKATRTHFSDLGIKTTMPFEKLVVLLSRLSFSHQ